MDATIVNAKATNGVNETANAVNKTPNAPSLRCKPAEPVNTGLAISLPPYQRAPSLSKYQGIGAIQTLLDFFRAFSALLEHQQPLAELFAWIQ